ncbi:DNA repair protein RecN [Salimicrobium jeotgali]|uniref:DNA repair protein RecN n=1 Tax=Salimicrobium jeotgali TaxID=1230341 RepID=K2H9F4_9BACI|nr:DNA repair protein RecN [Salimicrobium jeotgali]AKG04339.1 DNA repair protein RecN [Salimicrobium jeotgali]EKE32315.1 DNA repair protein RecN [Salimicrobium jeotgali]MBM7695928.1 DNA repair protein RecN (Recombination protein N) [Salimicrobium jeotgali]
MLTELTIRDFAIIDYVSLTLKDGLTVLTGETGAGKSIIIDSIQLLTGARGSVEFVKHGAKRAEIEGLFNVDGNHAVYAKGEEYGVEIDEDGMVVLQRSITHQGKSICRVNGKLVTLGVLREFGKSLIDIHSQHETQSLMDPERHIDLLDTYAAEKLQHPKQEYRKQYEKYRSLQKRYQELSDNEQEMAQRLDLLEFQWNELEEAHLSPKEDEELMEERNKLSNFEKIYSGLNDTYEALYGEQKGMDWVSHAMMSLEATSDYDENYQKMSDELSNAYYVVEELTFRLSTEMEALEFDPERLNEIEERLDEINRLKRKYGQSVEEMLEHKSKVEEEIDEINNKDSFLSKLESEINDVSEDLLLEAQHIHDIRSEAAKELVEAVHEELKDLYLEKSVFDVKVEKRKGGKESPMMNGRQVALNSNGVDEVRFMITTNPGEPLKPLHKIASGGEMSRIMLALKQIFSRHQGITSVIFDEVDTGVSGRVAQAIAEKIFKISVNSQVLCISHLPQVAAMADTHVQIQKNITDNTTKTNAKELDHHEKVEEVARMISGAELTETTLQNGRELLNLAESFKAKV